MSDYKKRLNGVARLHPELRPRVHPTLHLEPSLGVAQKEPYENYAEKQEKQELANKCTAHTMRARMHGKERQV